MPLYEYKCKKCGHRFERIQTYSAEDAKECPVCQGEVERLISAPNLLLQARVIAVAVLTAALLPVPEIRLRPQRRIVLRRRLRLLPSRNKLR
jgi:putative FmdB family regulatory protein